MKKALGYAFVLTLAYLGLAHATGGGTLIGAGEKFVVGVERTFQGR